MLLLRDMNILSHRNQNLPLSDGIYDLLPIICSYSQKVIMSAYYIRRGPKIHGPFSIDQIEKGLLAGKLRQTDQMADSRGGPWRKLNAYLDAATETFAPPFLDEDELDQASFEDSEQTPLNDVQVDDEQLQAFFDNDALPFWDEASGDVPETNPFHAEATSRPSTAAPSTTGPSLTPADEMALSGFGDSTRSKAAVALATQPNRRARTFFGRRLEAFIGLLEAGVDSICHALSVLYRFPIFLVPLLTCWSALAVLILYLEFVGHPAWANQYTLTYCLAVLFMFASPLAFSCLIHLEMIQQIETGRPPKLLDATQRSIRNYFGRALPIILLWAVMMFFTLLLEAIFSTFSSRHRNHRRDDSSSMEIAARTLTEDETGIFSFEYLIRQLDNVVRMFVFIMLPSIVWLNCGPWDAVKTGFTVVKQHFGHFVTGFVFARGVAIIFGLPLGIFYGIVNAGFYSPSDFVWLAVIVYGVFGGSFIIYLEQMFTAELFLWHVHWTAENKRRKSLDLPPLALGDIKRPLILDDVPDLKGMEGK